MVSIRKWREGTELPATPGPISISHTDTTLSSKNYLISYPLPSLQITTKLITNKSQRKAKL